ncbi:MAG: phosphate/phosphite/phosphonate ABC transporter substrate-binding protein [Planctomycetes bacterium]|nr:phosphate/phosphite/phosphonate ABC transporter substrate-binding protein [Planctomycetota bacterium]
MLKKALGLLVTCLTVLALSSGCKQDTNTSGNGGDAAMPATIKITGIPDSNQKQLKAEYLAIGAYLEKELGTKVQWVEVKDYAGAVTSLISGAADMAWLGGVTTVQAERVTKGNVTLVACRDVDLKFKSYVIANKDSAAKDVKDFAGLKAKAKDLKLVFGGQSSTSGHVMPRYFMAQAGLSPADFNGAPAFSGNHTATLEMINKGAGDVGMINYEDFDNKATPEQKANTVKLFETPEYVDYCWVARNELGAGAIGKVREALLKLDSKNPEHQKVLSLHGAGKFIEAKPEYWAKCREVVELLVEERIFNWS